MGLWGALLAAGPLLVLEPRAWVLGWLEAWLRPLALLRLLCLLRAAQLRLPLV
jgi:hypothetical protein